MPTDVYHDQSVQDAFMKVLYFLGVGILAVYGALKGHTADAKVDAHVTAQPAAQPVQPAQAPAAGVEGQVYQYVGGQFVAVAAAPPVAGAAPAQGQPPRIALPAAPADADSAAAAAADPAYPEANNAS